MTLDLPPQRFSLTDLQGRTLWFLLDLTWGGKVYHVAEIETTAPIGPDGADVSYSSGLEFSGRVEDRLALLAQAPVRKSVGVTIHLGDDVDPTAIVADGHVLGSARGRLFLWAEGTSSAIELVEGPLRNPSFDTATDPIAGTIEEEADEDKTLWPPENAVVDLTSWPNVADTNAEGQRYPWVLGAPALTGSEHESTQGLYITDASGTDDYLLINGEPVDATSVWVHNFTLNERHQETVLNLRDGYGRLCAVINMAASSFTGVFTSEDDWWIDWVNGSGVRQYGTLRGGSPIKHAGDVLLWWLEQSTIRWDRGRVSAILDRASQYAIDCYAMVGPNDRISPYSWIEDHLLPILPISALRGPKGLYFVWWDYGADATSAVAHLEHGRNCTRFGAVTQTKLEDVYSTVELRYADDARQGEYTSRIVLTGDPEVAANDADADTNLHLVRGFNTYGQRGTKQITTEVVQRDDTAARILAWRARYHASQRYVFEYMVDQETAGRLEVGSVVTITDADRNWSSEVCLVEGIGREAGGTMPVGLSSALDGLGAPA